MEGGKAEEYLEAGTLSCTWEPAGEVPTSEYSDSGRRVHVARKLGEKQFVRMEVDRALESQGPSNGKRSRAAGGK